MRKCLFLLLFMGCALLSKAQLFNDWQVESVMQRIPVQLTYSTTGIADYVKENFTDERKKLLAIYSWVSRNIKYDTDSADNINLGPDPGAKITAALRRRKGVCDNYAAIFHDICIKSGLTCFIVDGYTRQNGVVDKTGHSWCVVFVENNWLHCDPTWDQGTGQIKWFLVQPSEMIGSHMPFDPMWQLLHYPVSHGQFYSGNTYRDKDQPYFNYRDTIAAYIQMDSLERFKATAYRIQQGGLYNNLVKGRNDYTKMHIEIIRQDRDVELYNSAVAELNAATSIYNNFVQYRNKLFTPSITDKALQGLLDDIAPKLSVAHKNLDQIEKTEAVFKFSTEDIRNRLNVLASRVKEQKDFLHLYLNTATVNRQSLFYKQVTSAGK